MSEVFLNKVILITGASGVIGKELTTHFLKLGAIVCAQTHTTSIDAKENLHIFTSDFSKVGSGIQLVEAAKRAAGRIDFIINSAADQSSLDPVRTSAAEVARIMRINLDAPKEIIEAAATAGVSLVLNISSIEGLTPRAGHEIYGQSKAALDRLTVSAATDFAPMRTLGLRLGLIWREGIQESWPEGVAAWKQACPLGRLATASEVAGVIEFLLSPANSWATGSTYTFDGGIGSTSW